MIKYKYVFLIIYMRTTLELDDKEYKKLKLYCKENGMSLKGLFLLGAKKIMEESRK